MTFVTSPTSRSAQRTLDFSFGCMLLLLDRLRGIDRCILERRPTRRPVPGRHLSSIRSLYLSGILPFSYSFSNPSAIQLLGSRIFCLISSDRQIDCRCCPAQARASSRLRPSTCGSCSIPAVAIVLHPIFSKIAAGSAGRGRRRAAPPAFCSRELDPRPRPGTGPPTLSPFHPVPWHAAISTSTLPASVRRPFRLQDLVDLALLVFRIVLRPQRGAGNIGDAENDVKHQESAQRL